MTQVRNTAGFLHLEAGMSHLLQYLMLIGGFMLVAALAARLKVLKFKNHSMSRLTHRRQLPERALLGLAIVLIATVIKGAYWLPMQLMLATLVAYVASASYFHRVTPKNVRSKDRHRRSQVRRSREANRLRSRTRARR